MINMAVNMAEMLDQPRVGIASARWVNDSNRCFDGWTHGGHGRHGLEMPRIKHFIWTCIGGGLKCFFWFCVLRSNVRNR